jgi:hypothetical protein
MLPGATTVSEGWETAERKQALVACASGIIGHA